MIEFLFLDLDDTILDFQKAEYNAICKTVSSLGINSSDAICTMYHEINKAYWQQLERKEITREQLRRGRFQSFIQELRVDADPESMADTYERYLGTGHYFLPGAEEAVVSLAKKYKLYLVSNGHAGVQKGRLQSANISRWFEDIFISQEIGANKPDIAFFEGAFARIPGFDKSRAMIVGDSLTSDILGGINAGIATCWVNPGHKPGREDIRPDYEIESLEQLEKLLEDINNATSH